MDPYEEMGKIGNKNMKIEVVTTFHKEGLDTYGQRFLNSFAHNVPKEIKLTVYAENCVPVNPNSKQIVILDASHLTDLHEFKTKWKDVPKANGKCPFPERRPRDHHKEFKWDAVRFANKVYAVFDAVMKTDADWVVWMDADTYVHSPITNEEFESLLDPKHWITYVGRGKGSQSWPECGFYGINMHDPAAQYFLGEFQRMYDDAENGIFKLEEWHDSFVFGHILNDMKSKYPHFYDYTDGIYNKTAKTGGGGHPLINSVLGTWFDHMKGGRKDTGHSHKKDLMSQRKEKYWNEI